MPAKAHGMLETILAIDDSPQNRQLIEAQLSSAGYAVTLAASGEEALALFARYTPDLVLLDIMMPGLNGFEVFRRMRRLPGGQQTPIVFLTGAADPTTHKTALELGVDDFLSKPINRTELLIRVRSLMRVRRLHTELSFCTAQLSTQRDAFTRTRHELAESKELLGSELQPSLLHAMRLSDKLRQQSSLPQPAQLLGAEIHRITDSLQRAIQNLLDVDRAESGLLSPKLIELPLDDLVSGVWQRHSELANLRKQSVHLVSDLGARKILADAELLTRLIENLLDYTCKSAPEGMDIHLEARVDGDGNSVLLRVYDEGVGVPFDQREPLFNRHLPLLEESQKLRASDRVAITLCRLIAEAHSGRLYIEDRQPSGSAFCAQLPLAMSYLATGEARI